MALNFPSSPTIGQIYIDSNSGFSYEWDGTVWKSFSASSSSNIRKLDDISASFNGITTSFSITSNGTALTPPSPQSLIINLGGVVQDPSDDYSVSGSNLIFSTPPANGLTFSGVSLGPAITINTIPDGTVTDGSLIVSNNLNVVGVVTASAFFGDGSGLTGVGIGTDGSVNTTGIITASAFVGDGSGLTGTGSTVGIDTITNATFYPLFTQTTSGTVTSTSVADSKLTFNPSLGKLTATIVNSSSFVGNLTGDATGLSGTPSIIVSSIESTSLNSSGIVTSTGYEGNFELDMFLFGS